MASAMVNRPRKKKNERRNKEESNRNRMRLLKMKRATIRKKKMFGRHTQGRPCLRSILLLGCIRRSSGSSIQGKEYMCVVVHMGGTENV